MLLMAKKRPDPRRWRHAHWIRPVCKRHGGVGPELTTWKRDQSDEKIRHKGRPPGPVDRDLPLLPEAMREIMGDHAAFTVRNKKFVYYLHDHHGDGIISVCFKTEPGENEVLLASDTTRFYSPAYIGPRGWVGLRLDVGKIDWAEVDDQDVGLAEGENLVERSPLLVGACHLQVLKLEEDAVVDEFGKRVGVGAGRDEYGAADPLSRFLNFLQRKHEPFQKTEIARGCGARRGQNRPQTRSREMRFAA